jgi:hypothetical protein
MNICSPLSGWVIPQPPAASESFGGLGAVGLGVVIFIIVFLSIVFVWLIRNTGRRD